MSADKVEIQVHLAMVQNLLKPLRAIMTGSGETARALKATKDQLRELNREQKHITAFQKTAKSLAITSNALKSAQAEVKRIKELISTVGVPTKDMARAMDKATDTARQMKQAHNSLLATQQDLRDKLRASGIETTKLASAQLELKGKMASTTAEIDKQSAALAVANKRQQALHAARAEHAKMSDTRNRLGMGGATALATSAAISAPILQVIKDYAYAENAATRLKVAMMQKGGVVPETFAQINKLANDLGDKLPGTTADYQNMMTMLIRQGMTAKGVLGGLGEATAYLGVQLEMPMDAAAEFASKLQDATRTSESEMMGLMDTIQRTFYQGVDSNNMLEAFTKMSPIMLMIKKEGLEAAKAFAPLVVMADQAGMHGEAAGNAYRKVFQFALDKKHLAKANAALAGTGKNLDFSDGKGEFGGMDKLFEQLGKLKSLTTMQRNAVIKGMFGDDAEVMQVVAILLDKGKAGYEATHAKMTAQADIQRRVNEQLGTLKNLWDAASGTFTNAMVKWGEAIAPEVKIITIFIQDLSQKLGNFAAEHPVLTGFLLKTAAALTVIIAIFGFLAIALAMALTPLLALKAAMFLFPGAGAVLAWLNPLALLKNGLLFAGRAVMFLGRMFLLNPIGWAITGIATAAYLIYQNWEPIKAFFSGLWDGIKSGLASAWNYIHDKLVSLQNLLPDWIKEKLGIKAVVDIATQTKSLPAAQVALPNQSPALKKNMAALGIGLSLATGTGAQAITQDRLPITAPAYAGQSGSSQTNHVVIHAAPGMSEQQIADKVTQELNFRDRQNAAAQRSRLSDAH